MCHMFLILSYPREDSRTSRGWDRGRWPDIGVQRRTPRSGSRSCTVPARQPRVTGLWVAAPEGDAHRRRAAEAQQRWIGAVPDQQKRTAPERSVHRGSCGAGLETPRAGRRRHGGLAEIGLQMPRRREMPRSVGPRWTRRPAPPSLSSGAASAKPGRGMRRGTEKVCLRDGAISEPRTLFPLPASAGRGY